MKTTFPAYAALLILLLSALGAGQPVIKRSNRIVERAFAAWNSQDPDKLVAAYSDDIVYEDVPFGSLSNGRAEFRKFAVLTFSLVGDFKIASVNSWVENGHGFVEWVWSGVDKGLFKTGKPFSVRGVSVFEVRKGKISRNKDFYDAAAIMRQVGKLPE